MKNTQLGWAGEPRQREAEGTEKRTRSSDNLVKYYSEISSALNSHATTSFRNKNMVAPVGKN